MWKQLAIVLTAGVASGLVFVAPSANASVGLLVINYFAQLPLLLVGLSLGTMSVATAGLAALVSVTVVIGLAGALQYLIVFVIPAMVIVNRSLISRVGPDGTTEWYPTGNLLAILAGYGAIAFVAVLIMLAGQDGGLRGVIQDAIVAFITMFAPAVPEGDLIVVAEHWALSVPAMIVMSWILMIVINSAIAQSTLVASAKNFRPTPRYSYFELPRWLAAILAAALAVWALGTDDAAFIGRTLSMVFATPYFLLGLAVVHRLVRKWPARHLFLTIFYIMLLLILDWPSFAAVVGLGFAEQWFGLRRRFATGPSAKED